MFYFSKSFVRTLIESNFKVNDDIIIQNVLTAHVF